MYRLIVRCAMVALIAPLIALPASAQYLRQTPGSNVHVQSCTAQEGRIGYNHIYTNRHGLIRSNYIPTQPSHLAIDFRNISQMPMKEIDFGLVARGYMVAAVRDAGTFSPGVLIQHRFDVSREIFPLGTALPQCMVLRVVYEDGHVWQNPHHPRE
ncbi:MAG: hypothetical protein ACYDGW_09235 [Vulcanimicrobiaceae bacterium]